MADDGLWRNAPPAEGYEREKRNEFAHFLRIARGSAAEVRAQLYAAEDLRYLDPATARELRAEALALSKQIAALSKKLSRKLPLKASLPLR